VYWPGLPGTYKSGPETYYRWLALEYAARCGGIHHGLIETLFRYNNRSRMGSFLHRLQNLCTAHGDKSWCTERPPASPF
jgi:hypothetical protein